MTVYYDLAPEGGSGRALNGAAEAIIISLTVVTNTSLFGNWKLILPMQGFSPSRQTSAADGLYTCRFPILPDTDGIKDSLPFSLTLQKENIQVE